MPDSHPLPSILDGVFDDPPAHDEASTPRTRLPQIRRALHGTNDLAREITGSTEERWQPARASHSFGESRPRRRQRSASDEGLSRDSTGADEETGRRTKRRRLDEAPKKSIKYGYYGQVEPGRLKLDLVSCDGGEHMDTHWPRAALGPENLLRHDKSVYCSERPYINVVVRHADDTPFCLEELHIVGPEHGFTAPVREGLVYVGMTMNDLRRYIDPPPHARRAGLAPPQPTRRRYINAAAPRSPTPDHDRLTLSDALRDAGVHAALLRPTSTTPHPGPPCDPPTDTQTARPTTHQLSDSDPGPEDASPQDVLDFRLRRLRTMRRRLQDDDYDSDDRWAGLNRLPPAADADTPADDSGMWGRERLHALMSRARVRVEASDEEDERGENEDEDEDGEENDEGDDLGSAARGVLDAMEDPEVTCARFQIAKGKHKVAIRFAPAVSGRFVLLKLWAGRGNVDVQSVVARGYGGGRFFPAVQVR